MEMDDEKLIEVVRTFSCLWEVASYLQGLSGTMIYNLFVGVVYYRIQSA